MRITRRQWRRLGTLVFLGLTVWLVLAARQDRGVAAITQAIRERGRLPFFAAMTLLPLTGFPVTPFYVLSGSVFGEWFSLAAIAVSSMLNLLLCYGMAVRWMRAGLEALLARRGNRRMPDFSGRGAWFYTLAIRATPGPPYCIKNYLAGLAGVPLLPYLAVSWPIGMGYAAGFVVVGDALSGQHWVGFGIGLLLMGLFLAVMAGARTYLRSRRGRGFRKRSVG